MCGIGGWIMREPPQQAQELAKELLPALERRGREATGYYTNLPNSLQKLPLPASKFVQTSLFQRRKGWGVVALLHTRLATSGSPKDNKNNQPLSSKRYVIVHNGNVWNERAAFPSYKFKTENDTEVILALLHEGGQKRLQELEGSAAIAVWDKRSRRLLLWRWRLPLAIASLLQMNGYVFASTPSILLKAITATFPEGLGFSPVIQLKELQEGEWISIDSSLKLRYGTMKGKDISQEWRLSWERWLERDKVVTTQQQNALQSRNWLGLCCELCEKRPASIFDAGLSMCWDCWDELNTIEFVKCPNCGHRFLKD